MTAGVKRQYLGCAGKVANGINTVHLSYVREGTGHALIGARQWVPREQIADPVRSLVMGLPLDLAFRTKGQLAVDISTDAAADGIRPDFYCGDEVLRFLHPAARALRGHRPGLRAASALELHDRPGRGHEADLRSGCRPAAEGQAALGGPLGRPRLQRRALVRLGLAGYRVGASPPADPPAPRTGELAFHYCFVPAGQLLTKARLIRAAGLRWPVEEDFSFAKDCFALDQCQVRLYTAIARHAVLVMAALAICAITAAQVKDRTDTQAPPPVRPDQPPPPEPGMIPLTIPEIKRLLAALTTRALPRRLVIHWDAWTRRHQARARWFHKRTRLACQPEFVQVKL